MVEMYHDPGRVDYQWIKQTAKQQGTSVNDLIVLAPQNDPFYTGTPNDWALGQWFGQMWQQLGETRAHLRRVHYYLVSLGNVMLPNGKPYENTVECWDVLGVASKAARYLRLVDPAAFNDRRTPEVMLYARPYSEPDPYVWIANRAYRLDMEFPGFPSLPRYQVSGFAAHQPCHLEVWCEKSTMNDILAPLCKRYGANLQTGMGEMSITATLALVHRLSQAGKPARILYVSDFDPAGQSMPVAVSRKIEYFVRTFGLSLSVCVFPVVLTLEQVQHYQLPRTPIKETERRRAGFEGRHGEGAVELDALEALYPGHLEQVLASHLDVYYDHTLEERVVQRREELEQELGQRWGEIMASYRPLVEELEQEHNLLRQRFEDRMGDLAERLRALWDEMERHLDREGDVLEDYEVPSPYWGQELGTGLYNSGRSYLEQVEAYKLFQGRLGEK